MSFSTIKSASVRGSFEVSTFSYDPRVDSVQIARAGAGTQRNVGRCHSSGTVWKSLEVSEREQYEKFRKAIGRLWFPARNSPFLPRTFEQYVSHRADILIDRALALNHAIALKKEQTGAEVMPVFGGRSVGAWVVLCSGQHISKHVLDEDEEFNTRAEELLGETLLREI